MQDRGEVLELSRWAFVKDAFSTLQLQVRAGLASSLLPQRARRPACHPLPPHPVGFSLSSPSLSSACASVPC